jgi:uncharacterized membrane protein
VDRAVAALKRPHSILVALTFAIYAAYSVSRYNQYLTAGYDLGIFDQVVRRYSHFQAPIVPLKGPGYNVYGDHFHPILAAIAPLYWIWSDPRVLLLVQAALIALSVWIVHRYCSRHLQERVALALTAAYALGWPLQAMANFDFHEVAFAVPLLAWAVDSVDRESLKEMAAACVLLLLVREDMGLLVAILSVIALWRTKRKRLLILTGVGLVMYYFTTSIVLPHFNPAGKFAYWTYDSLGKDLPSALKHLVTHPWDGVRLFFSPVEKSWTIFWLFAPLLFLSLGSPYTLLLLPILAERFFSSREFLWGMRFHYSSLLWPVLLMGAIDTARRLRWLDREKAVRIVVAFAVAVPVVGTAAWSRIWPLHRAITGHAFHSTYNARSQQQIVDAIPHDVCVMVDDRIAPHLTAHDKVSLPTAPATADFIALDLSSPKIGYLMPDTDTIYLDAMDQGYSLVKVAGHFLLLRRPGYSGPSRSCTPSAK